MKISYNIDLPKNRKGLKYFDEYNVVKLIHEGQYANASMEYDPDTDIERIRRALNAYMHHKRINDVGTSVVKDRHLLIVYRKGAK